MNRTLLKSARLFHLYSGVFFAPALLFFAFTGALQTFSFHETTKGSSYAPPAILVKLAQLHKKETLILPERKGPPPAEKADPQPAVAPPKPAFDPSHLGDHTNQQKHDRLENVGKPQSSPPLTPTAPDAKPTARTPQKTHNLIPMKIFSFAAGVGLFLSTLTGLYMSYKYARNQAVITAWLAAGILIPLVVLYLQ